MLLSKLVLTKRGYVLIHVLALLLCHKDVLVDVIDQNRDNFLVHAVFDTKIPGQNFGVVTVEHIDLPGSFLVYLDGHHQQLTRLVTHNLNIIVNGRPFSAPHKPAYR